MHCRGTCSHLPVSRPGRKSTSIHRQSARLEGCSKTFALKHLCPINMIRSGMHGKLCKEIKTFFTGLCILLKEPSKYAN